MVNDVQHLLIHLQPSLYLLQKNVYSGPLPIFSSDCLFDTELYESYIFDCVAVGVVITKLHPALCNSMDSSMPGFPVLHHLLEFAQIHVH